MAERMVDNAMMLLAVLVGSLTLSILVAWGLLQLVIAGMAKSGYRGSAVESNADVRVRAAQFELRFEPRVTDQNTRIAA
jgi:hypothetical protein